jgi:hypothetical protein
MKGRLIIIGALCAVALGFACAMLSFGHRTWTHVSDVYPEYATLDSVYIHARGFPLPQWAVNDPELSGVGAAKSAVLWSGILINWGLYVLGIGVLEIPILIVVGICWWCMRNVRGKRTANQASDATSEPAPGAGSSAHQG